MSEFVSVRLCCSALSSMTVGTQGLILPVLGISTCPYVAGDRFCKVRSQVGFEASWEFQYIQTWRVCKTTEALG